MLLLAYLIVPHHVKAAGKCVGGDELRQGVVRIQTLSQQVHWSGTAWFYGSTHTLVTNAHVVKKLQLGQCSNWTIQLYQETALGKEEFRKDASVVSFESDSANDVAVLQLGESVGAAKILSTTHRALRWKEPLLLVGYGGYYRLHIGRAEAYQGNAAAIAQDYNQEGALPIDAVDTDDTPGLLVAFSSGSSGSPVFDCEGFVIGIYSGFLNVESFWEKKTTTSYPSAHLSPNAFMVAVTTLERLRTRQ
jgi:S1-C subfamily serine protease